MCVCLDPPRRAIVPDFFPVIYGDSFPVIYTQVSDLAFSYIPFDMTSLQQPEQPNRRWDQQGGGQEEAEGLQPRRREGKQVLDGVSFVAPAGAKVGVVGRTGIPRVLCVLCAVRVCVCSMCVLCCVCTSALCVCCVLCVCVLCVCCVCAVCVYVCCVCVWV